MTNQALLQTSVGWLLFRRPVQVITAVSPHDVVPALRQIETAVNTQNLYAIGTIGYEAAAAFELAVHEQTKLPLLWFGLYENPEPVSDPSDLKKSGGSYHLGQWQPSLTKETYRAAIKRIKEAIAAGDTYQVNYTFPLHNSFSGDDFAFFTDLAAAQQADYAAYLDLGHIAICSASPELFFKLDGDQLTSKPMKGTAVR
ncbi:MAG: aminodeoxychorismate synthase, component I, partial [Chloroflexi bacterium]|nr:aminodeoxychorismate synthase, component I [Chloroflexota bacterium]